jgi:UDP-N-acetylglucosamine 2-epimerase (non-hydrolysing)
MKKKIVIIVGTRPEAIKLIPVFKELRKVKQWEVVLVSTGQHKEMLDQIFVFFDVSPHHDFSVMVKNQGLDRLTSSLLAKCSDFFDEVHPDLVIVQGDTTTSMAATLAAYYKKIQVAHVEAGLRSYNIQAPFPEEVNRRIISLIADFHFAPTTLAMNVLRYEKAPGRLLNVGNTVIDSLLQAKKLVRQRKAEFAAHYEKLLKGYDRMILITGHRRENFGKGFEDICQAIRDLAVRYPKTSFVYPVHLNPNVRGPVFTLLDSLPNVFLIDPVPYDHMVFLMMQCYLILTDSGGIQEEGPTLGKPVIVMRETTERPEGIKAGCNVLAGTSRIKIVRLTKSLLEDKKVYARMSRAKNPYGEGDSSVRIRKALQKYL